MAVQTPLKKNQRLWLTIEDVSFEGFAEEEEEETDSYTGEAHTTVKEVDDFDDISEDVELPEEDEEELLDEEEDENDE